jgi:hypothetical membrane protein
VKTRTIILFSICGIAAPILLTTVVIIEGMLYPGYSHVTQTVSELGVAGSPVALLHNVSSFVIGVLLISFACTLYAVGTRERKSIWGPIFIGFFGLSYTGYAFFPCDPGSEFISAAGYVHNILAMFAFLSVLAGIFIVSRSLTPDPNWGPKYRRYSVITSAAGLIALILWISIASPVPPGVSRLVAGMPAANGILQRLFLAIVLQWIEVIAIHLFVVLRGRQAV